MISLSNVLSSTCIGDVLLTILYDVCCVFVQFLEDIALVRKASVIPPEDKVKVRLYYCSLLIFVTIRYSVVLYIYTYYMVCIF